MLRFALAALAAAPLAITAQPAFAEVKEAAADHFVVRGSVDTTADSKAAWLALIAPAKWWDKAHTWSGDAANLTLTPQGGGCFCERIPEDNSGGKIGLAGSAQHMSVLQSEPMAVLRMRGGLGPLQSEPAEGVLTVTMKPIDGGGTRIAWEYVVGGYMRYETPKIAKAVDAVLGQQFGKLADLLGRANRTEPAPAEKPDGAAPSDAEPASSDAAPEQPAASDPAAVGDALDAMAAQKSTPPK
ncbi:MAG: SRPBCC family protein [Tsuneonella sp.]